uniref:Uncharacterized protein n=1 Tax=Pithovirus LCPAC401 TaxID=2506595 RepID=A0A481ZAN2_9VIRU|nr:MAG: hypothetical protein LCPAC401_04750 [Pithovirus LCPAC401]
MSDESLCEKCEINEFPERFTGCIFCRAPQRHSYCCIPCSSAFSSWVRKNTNINEDMAVFNLCHTRQGIARLPFMKIRINIFSRWPGFYTGDDKWRNVDVKMETQEVVTEENCDKILEKMLLENGIDIFASVQLDPSY